MFKKILIANRGEIACHIIATARRLGIMTVAVYSDADQDALHRTLADEAIRIGPAPAAQSYLAVENIVQACQSSGAEAVHPGYGFLSENARFAERIDQIGLTFIGPPAQAIASMGDKVAAKRLARQAGVNTVPGRAQTLRGAHDAVAAARELGYPVMLKARGGGGGRGMRLVSSDDECRDGFLRAANEARTSVGDERVFVEKYINHPRHIEFQVLADRHGQIIHLGERECSLQRRHQKVIEEAPSPLLDEAMRAAMGEQAIALARAIDYQSAGTVEFIVDADRNFYFLEMNTRLQVEYAVTEQIMGLDLVEWMIRIAAGDPLPLTQDEVRPHGWAVEARVYAEDPCRNFLPSAGRLVRYLPPTESAAVRVDSGVHEGTTVTMHYDPMLAKVITHGSTRDEAIGQMSAALDEFFIRGVSHNIGFLAALIDHPHFRAGRFCTNLIAEQYARGFHPDETAHVDPELLIAVAASIHRRHTDRAARISGQLAGYERQVQDRWVVVMRGKLYPVTVAPSDAGYLVEHANRRFQVISDWQFGEHRFWANVNGQPICVQVERRDLVYRLSHRGLQADVMVLTQRAAELLDSIPAKPARNSSNFLRSPMPGLLSQLLVKVGHEVKIGQHLVIVEAMKMENVLCAERDGRIAKVMAGVGDTLAVEQPILEFE
jgi:propionyl-CoA carboxylase alpha chain